MYSFIFSRIYDIIKLIISKSANFAAIFVLKINIHDITSQLKKKKIWIRFIFIEYQPSMVIYFDIKVLRFKNSTDINIMSSDINVKPIYGNCSETAAVTASMTNDRQRQGIKLLSDNSIILSGVFFCAIKIPTVNGK